MKTSVASVTFRAKSIKEIAELAKKAGLDAIEWGGDIHVPPNNNAAAKDALNACVQNGLEVSAYGSYYKADEAQQFEPVLYTAQLLQCRIIRVWAGTTASLAISQKERSALTCRLNTAAQQAAKAGIVLALEYHADTLTDTAASTAALLESVPLLKTLWQPPVGRSHNQNLQEIEMLKSRLENIHVYHRDMSGACMPLAEGSNNWKQYFKLTSDNPSRFATLEFVKDASEEQFLNDAEALHTLLKETEK